MTYQYQDDFRMSESANLNSLNDQHHESLLAQKRTIADLEAKWRDMPDKYFIIVAHLLAGHINNTDAIDEFNGPILKASIKSVYWLFIIQYAALAIIGITLNVAIIIYIVYHRLYKDTTHSFIVNLALCHFVQCALVLPITLTVMLIQNWIFGQFICFFLPMLQDIPLHVVMITHVLIAWDRLRLLGHPLRGRLPAFVSCCTSWLTGMVVALPYPIYTIYVEIGEYVPRLDGMGLCIVNLMDDMHEYMRVLFVFMFCAPAVLLVYLYIRTSQALCPPERSFAAIMYNQRQRESMRNRLSNSSVCSDVNSFTGGQIEDTTSTHFGSGFTTLMMHKMNAASQQHSTSSITGGGTGAAGGTSGTSIGVGGSGLVALSSRTYDLYSGERDNWREKQRQRIFGRMAAAQVVCICPLMILRFARLSMVETYDNAKHFDFTYLMFVWIAFLPTVIFPYIYGTQFLPRTEQERLRGYFRLGGSYLSKSDDATERGSRARSGTDLHSKNTQTDAMQATSIVPDMRDFFGADVDGIVTSYPAHELQLNASKYKHHVNCDNVRQSIGDDEIFGHHSSGVSRIKNHKSKKSLLGCSSSISQEEDKIMNRTAKLIQQSRKCQGDGMNPQQQQQQQQQRRTTIDSLDNHSCLTSSTYCNRSSSILDDTASGDYGDGEDSSISAASCIKGSSLLVHYDKKRGYKNVTTTTTTTTTTTSNQKHDHLSLSNEFNISPPQDSFDGLEESDSEMYAQQYGNSQDILLSELNTSDRRKLPNIDNLYPQQSGSQLDDTSSTYPYISDLSTSLTGISTKSMKHHHNIRTGCYMSISQQQQQQENDLGSLMTVTDSYANETTINEDTRTAAASRKLSDQNKQGQKGIFKGCNDNEQAQEFFDNCNTDEGNIIPIKENQYQYNRRLIRMHSHQSQTSSNSHRGTKRDSLNSLNGSDLIAGAFGELEPTPQLAKLSSSTDNSTTRSRNSVRNFSFSSASARSSIRSRDSGGHGTMHTPHPELDLRENIFAEL